MLQIFRPWRSSHSFSSSHAEIDAAPDRARQEGPEALPHPCAGRILGRRHPHVVAAVVLDEEVAVAALSQRDLAQPALELVALVPEVVCRVDRDPADYRLGQRQPDLVENAQVSAGPHRAREHEARVLEGQEGVRAPAVVAIPLEPLEDAVGRVLRVQADQPVKRREHAEDQDRPEEPERSRAGQLHQSVDDERQRRHHHAEQPGVALAVAPGRQGASVLFASCLPDRRCMRHRAPPRIAFPRSLHQWIFCQIPRLYGPTRKASPDPHVNGMKCPSSRLACHSVACYNQSRARPSAGHSPGVRRSDGSNGVTHAWTRVDSDDSPDWRSHRE